MNWKQQLEAFEDSKEWRQAISLLESVAQENPCNPESFVRIIYLLHNLLVEEDYKSSGLGHDYLANLLLNCFRHSSKKFENNAEYLFFTGIIMHVAEWYFGEKNEQLALQFQKRATEIEPKNILYEFSYRFSKSEKARASELLGKILSNNEIVMWLHTKGFPGAYVLRMIQYSPNII